MNTDYFWKLYHVSTQLAIDQNMESNHLDVNVSQNDSNNLTDQIMLDLRNLDLDDKYLLMAVEEDESEMSSEYAQFIAITRKHQKERKKFKKEQAEQLQRTEYKSITQIEIQQRITNQEKEIRASNAVRFDTHAQMYGAMAKKIANQESQLQCEFNEFCDQYQPSFWPVMPLRIHFN